MTVELTEDETILLQWALAIAVVSHEESLDEYLKEYEPGHEYPQAMKAQIQRLRRMSEKLLPRPDTPENHPVTKTPSTNDTSTNDTSTNSP